MQELKKFLNFFLILIRSNLSLPAMFFGLHYQHCTSGIQNLLNYTAQTQQDNENNEPLCTLEKFPATTKNQFLKCSYPSVRTCPHFRHAARKRGTIIPQIPSKLHEVVVLPKLTLKQKFLSMKFGWQGRVLQSMRFSSFRGSGRLCSWIINSPRSLSTTQYWKGGRGEERQKRMIMKLYKTVPIVSS